MRTSNIIEVQCVGCCAIFMALETAVSAKDKLCLSCYASSVISPQATNKECNHQTDGGGTCKKCGTYFGKDSASRG